jgi:uncharacterized protein
VIIVSNTSPINNLAAAGHLSLLEQLYGNIIIPVAVSQELSAVQTPIAVATQVQASPWIQVRQVGNFATVATILLRVDRGEAEAIALALELNADLLLIDERKGRAVASSLGISMTGVLGVLIEAKSKGLILAVKPVLNDVITRAGFWVQPDLYTSILNAVGE